MVSFLKTFYFPLPGRSDIIKCLTVTNLVFTLIWPSQKKTKRDGDFIYANFYLLVKALTEDNKNLTPLKFY